MGVEYDYYYFVGGGGERDLLVIRCWFRLEAFSNLGETGAGGV
jgi:hypothetical protein